MQFNRLLIAMCFLLTSAAFSQRLTIGVVGGTNLTNNFPVTEYSNPADQFGNPPNYFRFRTGGRSPILGVSLETHLKGLFSFEANVLHRPMKSEITFTEFLPNDARRTSINEQTAVRAWEFPLLLKMHLPTSGRLRPFVAFGPSFRTQEEPAGTEPSQVGFSAGAGATLSLGRFRISPTLRYTRWAKENVFPRYATKPDQVEFLTSFGIEGGAELRRMGGRKIEIGALLGLPLTASFAEVPKGSKTPELTRYMAGLTAQMKIKDGWSLEVDGIYKPLRAKSNDPKRPQDFSVLTWQFPVLGKYSWSNARWRPFAIAGPSFRLSGNLNGYNPSSFGMTVGGGLETKATSIIRLSPGIRYTRWAKDRFPFPQIPGFQPDYNRTSSTALELVFGVSF